ncbi:MAG: RNA methyltransferase [Desulfobacterales bacterium]|jgi:putative N6-adenine-specific DNA methylase|nr:RNA methyltransferase [Desulfobacterales bacterium]
MAMNPSLEKRIKRQVIGKPHRFFAVSLPGTESLCLAELNSVGLAGELREGGVEFEGRLQDLYTAHLMLRTAGRILMRLVSFRAVSFQALQAAAEAFAWELFIAPGASLRLRVTTHHCRLYHTEAVAERIRAAIAARTASLPPAPEAPGRALALQQIFVRGVDDRFTVSLDGSGESLYRRGVKTHGGPAPLRETLAAAALMLAGYSGEEVLLDPMCGAGTFALEAAMMAKRLPPGWHREFAFMGWPGFRSKRWEFLKRRAGAGIRRREAPCIYASDLSRAACERLEQTIRGHDLADAVAVACRDFFDLDPRTLGIPPGLVALNPPYGRRLGSPARGVDLLQDLLGVLAERYRGWRVLLIAPPAAGRRRLPFKATRHRLAHGGLRIDVLYGRVPA